MKTLSLRRDYFTNSIVAAKKIEDLVYQIHMSDKFNQQEKRLLIDAITLNLENIKDFLKSEFTEVVEEFVMLNQQYAVYITPDLKSREEYIQKNKK